MADSLVNEPHTDPDAQATVTDFIDYTEHLPSDVRRSLALIEKLNKDIFNAQHEVHELTKRWNAGPVVTNGATADEVARDLRARISYQKNLSSRYAAAAFAEALRMNDEIERHKKLIQVTGVKLDALALPPSRDPTPKPLLPSQSPQAIRSGGGRGGEPKTGSNRIAARPSTHHGSSRRKRVIIPGEVLPPPNPDSPTPSDFSDWSPDPPVRHSPNIELKPREDKKVRLKINRPEKKEKSDKIKSTPKPPRTERRPGEGTNVHSQVAGISTSNALAKLTPPPIDAPKGSHHAPWMRLTEYEMAKLRKRMKKNAIWAPSDTMIRRELTDAGRGPDAYRKARLYADETDTEFVDCDDLANRDPGIGLRTGEIPLDTVKAKVLNKGMSLNVQKKEKKALEQRQRAEQARLEAEQAAKNLGQLGESFKNLFDRPSDEKIVLKPPTKKRKRDSVLPVTTDDSMLHSQLHSEIIVTPTTATKPSNAKKQRKAPSGTPTTPKPLTPIAPSSTSTAPPPTLAPAPPAPPNNANSTTTTTIPLAAPAPSPAKEKTPTIQAPPSPAPRKETRRLSLVLKPPTEPHSDIPPPPLSSRTQSRPSSRRASAGPPPEAPTRERLRRKSATPGPSAPLSAGLTATLASRRSKRPPPGQVTSSQEGNAISVGKRDKKPSKKAKKSDAAAALKEEVLLEEDDVDPDEPRYCVCGDVSYGTMVMCENQDCEKEWFHLECVGLADIPSRRAKWWCPECSVKLGKNKAG